MALKNRIVAFIAGVLLGPAIVWAGLETGTYISDLVATNPLSSDLASTADDHIRLIKSTVKATFPNINNAVTVTDELLNGIPTGSANPTGTIGLSAVNGSATTYLRSDGAPALSQAIAPTWTDLHTFSNSPTSGIDGSILLTDTSNPILGMRQSGATTDNKVWDFILTGEQFRFRTSNDSGVGNVTIMAVDRTGTTVDRVAFPTDSAAAFVVGTIGTNYNNTRLISRTPSASAAAALLQNVDDTIPTLQVQNEDTAGNNVFVLFRTEAGSGTTRGLIDFDRTGVVTRYVTTSDERLKKNFKPAPSARSVIDCVKVESFDWKETGYHVNHGFVAQRLKKCAPYAVSSSDEPSVTWGVDPSKLVPALIKYVQEQDARIARLEANANRRH